MGTYTPKQYQAVWRKRVKALKLAGVKTASQAASLLVATARSYAPRKTGETAAGIRKRKTKKSGYKVESWVSGIFKQNMWVNQTSPFGAPRMWWNERKPTIYGDGTHRTTSARIPFFTSAVLQVKKRFKKIGIQNTRKALRVGI